MSLSNFLKNLTGFADWQGISNAGLFNIETGYASFRTEWVSKCECSIALHGALQYKCKDCKKNLANNLTVPSGDGDGLYSVITFLNGRGEVFASATLFDTDSALATNMISEIKNGSIRNFDSISSLFVSNYHGTKIGNLHLRDNSVLYSDASAGKDSPEATVTVTNWVSGSLSVFAFLEDSIASADAQAAIALGTSPSVFTGGLETSFRIRAILVISDGYSKLHQDVADVTFDEPYWQEQISAWSKQLVHSHAAPVSETAIYWNGRLENCFAAFASENNLGNQMDYFFKEFSWYLQGSTFGSQACKEELDAMVSESNGELEEPDLIRAAYLFRGLTEKANQI